MSPRVLSVCLLSVVLPLGVSACKKAGPAAELAGRTDQAAGGERPVADDLMIADGTAETPDNAWQQVTSIANAFSDNIAEASTAGKLKLASAVNYASLGGVSEGDAYKFMQDYLGTDVCQKVRREKMNVNACQQFCDAFHPVDVIDKGMLYTYWTTWLTGLRAGVGPVAVDITNALMRPVAWVLQKGNVAIGSPLPKPAPEHVSCAVSVLGYLAVEMRQTNFCAKYPGSGVMACGMDRAAVTGCRVWDAFRTCGGGVFKKLLAAVKPLQYASAACMAGGASAYVIRRYSAAKECVSARLNAFPVSRPRQVRVERPEGPVTVEAKRCCRCDVALYKSLPFGARSRALGGGITGMLSALFVPDTAFRVDERQYFYSNVSDVNEPVRECEGKVSDINHPFGLQRDGYPVYKRYTSCQKLDFEGQVCPDPVANQGRFVPSLQDRYGNGKLSQAQPEVDYSDTNGQLKPNTEIEDWRRRQQERIDEENRRRQAEDEISGG